MRNSKELLGARIREVRKGLKMSQEQLSEMVDVDPRYISRIERGNCFPSLETLESIAHSLRVEMRELFDYGHLANKQDCQEEIGKVVAIANDDRERQLILKITKAVARTVLNDV